jgi:hypothetical protein
MQSASVLQQYEIIKNIAHRACRDAICSIALIILRLGPKEQL